MPRVDPAKNREYQKRWYQKNKALHRERCDWRRTLIYKRNVEYVRRVKRLFGCQVCREREPVCLDFHHLGQKDNSISRLLGSSKSRLKAEMRKCVVLCSNCHRKLHAGLLSLPPWRNGSVPDF